MTGDNLLRLLYKAWRAGLLLFKPATNILDNWSELDWLDQPTLWAKLTSVAFKDGSFKSISTSFTHDWWRIRENNFRDTLCCHSGTKLTKFFRNFGSCATWSPPWGCTTSSFSSSRDFDPRSSQSEIGSTPVTFCGWKLEQRISEELSTDRFSNRKIWGMIKNLIWKTVAARELWELCKLNQTVLRTLSYTWISYQHKIMVHKN